MSDGGAQHFSFGPFFDDDGAIYRGIVVLIDSVGTTSAKTYWTDEDKTTAVNSGVLTDADADGIARAFFDGDYRFRVGKTGSTHGTIINLDNAIDWDDVKITSDTATMWEGNFGTSFPTAAVANRWHQFAKVTAGNKLVFMGINIGAEFVTYASPIGVGADVASGNALPVINDGDYFDVTGTTGITSIDAIGVGRKIHLHFDDALIITHDGTNLVLPNGENITTIAEDEMTFVEYASGDWRLIAWSRPDNLVIAGVSTFSGVVTFSAPPTLDGSAWPSFSVHRDGATQGSLSGTTKIVWTTEEFDTNSDFASNKFTPTVAGKYLLSARVALQTSPVDQDNLIILLYKNGVSYKEVWLKASGTTTLVGPQVTVVVDANGSTDNFEIFFSSANDEDVSGNEKYTYWTGCRIG